MAELASQQHGLVAVVQIEALGVGRSAVRHRLDRGVWASAARGVVRLGGAPITWESRLLAHVLAAGEGAVASHRSAARLWGIDAPRSDTPELTLPGTRRYRARGVTIHHSTDLDRIRPVRRSGIATTPVDRTLLDLGAIAGDRAVLVAIDSARRRKLTTWDRLLDTLVLHARRGRDGVGTLRAILDEHFGEGAVTDSGFERLVLSVLRQAGLPTPVLQHEIRLGRRTYRLDLAYPDHRLAIELDGTVHLERAVWQHDHERQNALVLAGWTVLRFTWSDYMTRRFHLINEVRSALAHPNF